jgi:hypothetical protein
MPPRSAVLLAAALVASTLVGAEANGASGDGKAETGGATTRAGGKSPSRADDVLGDARKKERDEEIIKHLDEIERLELLQNLELFDSERKK